VLLLWQFTDVSEVLAVSIIRAMMEAVSISETRLHGITTQKTAIFILAAVISSDPILYLFAKTVVIKT
jgi:hypothetical protein